jgi:hypothetical protein
MSQSVSKRHHRKNHAPHKAELPLLPDFVRLITVTTILKVFPMGDDLRHFPFQHDGFPPEPLYSHDAAGQAGLHGCGTM